MRIQNCFDSNLAYMDHSLPPLGLFLQIKLNFLSLSQAHLLKHKERYFKRNWSKIQKLLLFPIIKPSPHKRPTFDNKRQTRVFWQTKSLTLLFSKFSSGSWSISFFGLIFSPFGIKHQNGINFGPFNPIASPKSSTKSKKAIRVDRWTWSELLSHRSAVEVLHGPSPPFSFQSTFETKSSKLKHMVSLKGSSCSTSPPKYVHDLQMDLRGPGSACTTWAP
jgi:hypothetical protein